MHHIHRLFEHSRDLMCVATFDGYFKEVNPAFRRLLGYTNEELTGESFLELIHPGDRAATLDEMRNLSQGQVVLQFENRYRCKDGSFKWLAWAATPSVEENLVYAVARDVTDSKQSLDDLMGDLPGMVYRCLNDAAWTMNYVSNGCDELTGYTRDQFVEERSITYNEVVHPQDRERLHESIQTASHAGREFQLEYRITTAQGKEKIVWEKGRAIVDERGNVSSLQGYIFDITDRRKMRDEVLQLQRMESLGQLTGGVAHDFNNLLTIMIGNLQLLESQLAKDAAGLELVNDALDSAWRGAELCKRLLAFGRRQMLSPEPTHVNALITKLEKLLRHSVNTAIAVEFALQPDLPEVVIDQSQLENAILNLAVNARDAMPGGGTLDIHTDFFNASEEYAELHPDVDARDYVVIEVSDSGSGMPRDIQDRAFEPFFTTKEQGKGTGLGLSMVYGLLKQSGGHVRIYSEPGHGTSVKLYVPVPLAIDTSLSETARFEALDMVSGGTERILVVEDDPRVRKMVVTTLSELGYAIHEADCGTAALEHLKQPHNTFDLLFTDVIMPGAMDGVALANQAVARSPQLKVLLTSGFSKRHAAARGNYALLNKPYHSRQLASAVRQVLDS